jgi:hypothetical protein
MNWSFRFSFDIILIAKMTLERQCVARRTLNITGVRSEGALAEDFVQFVITDFLVHCFIM